MSAPGKRPEHHTKKCKQYRSENRREKNRDARAARIQSHFQKKES